MSTVAGTITAPGTTETFQIRMLRGKSCIIDLKGTGGEAGLARISHRHPLGARWSGGGWNAVGATVRMTRLVVRRFGAIGWRASCC